MIERAHIPVFDYNGIMRDPKPGVIPVDEPQLKVCCDCRGEFVTKSRIAIRCEPCRVAVSLRRSISNGKKRREQAKAARLAAGIPPAPRGGRRGQPFVPGERRKTSRARTFLP